jgi:hypothetical protein
MYDLALAQARSVIFKRKLVFCLVMAEAAQAIGVCEFAELLQLFPGERRLQLESDFHECHSKNYTSDRNSCCSIEEAW